MTVLLEVKDEKGEPWRLVDYRGQRRLQGLYVNDDGEEWEDALIFDEAVIFAVYDAMLKRQLRQAGLAEELAVDGAVP